MISYTYKESSKVWDCDYVTMNTAARTTIVKENFRIIPVVREWLDEHGYQYEVVTDRPVIRFPDDSHAFAFKMRWL